MDVLPVRVVRIRLGAVLDGAVYGGARTGRGRIHTTAKGMPSMKGPQ